MSTDVIRSVFVPIMGEAWFRYKKQAHLKGIDGYDTHMAGIEGMSILAAGVLGNDELTDEEAQRLCHFMISVFADRMIDSLKLRGGFVEKIKDPEVKEDMSRKTHEMFPWLKDGGTPDGAA